MKRLIWILGDQLNHSSNLLQNLNLETDEILLIESQQFAKQHKHHKKKLIFQFSAMRHFAEELREKGLKVNYIKLESKLGEKSFEENLNNILEAGNFTHLKVMEAADYDCQVLQKNLQTTFSKLLVEIVDNDLFITTKEDLRLHFIGKKSFLMETYYRFLRRKHKVLLTEDGKPLGGQWNFDKDNRKPLKNFQSKLIKHTPNYPPDQITTEVIELVEQFFPDSFSITDNFFYPVTRLQALEQLHTFLDQALPYFGDYQDAMYDKHWHLFHGLLSYLMNFGLLHPMEVIQAAEQKFLKSKTLPINAVEGFIRQILGWREYIYAIYQTQMPSFKTKNFFDHKRKLPSFFWTAETQMNCLKHSIGQTITEAYAHHIQRLMVIGNFCLLAGIDPAEVCEWYLIVYIDALEWVELPNTLGMSQYADGGIVGSKPYVSSGKYIDRMSNYCKSCHYDVKQTYTDNACPFNYLYWNFLLRNFEKLKNNPRMGIAFKNVLNKSPDELKQINFLADRFFNSTSFLN